MAGSSRVDVQWYGDDFIKIMEDEILQAVKDGASKVIDTANVPVGETGNLKRSGRITHFVKTGQAIGAYARYGNTTDVDYAFTMEVRRPYLRPALNSSKRFIFDQFKDRF